MIVDRGHLVLDAITARPRVGRAGEQGEKQEQAGHQCPACSAAAALAGCESAQWK